jgi:hypothetical protein
VVAVADVMHAIEEVLGANFSKAIGKTYPIRGLAKV